MMIIDVNIFVNLKIQMCQKTLSINKKIILIIADD